MKNFVLKRMLELGLETMVPQTPFLLSGPDILAREGNSMFSVFIPSPSELKTKQLLLGRIVGSLLSYPSFVLPVVFLEEADRTPISSIEAKVRVISSLNELGKFLRGGHRISNANEKAIRHAKAQHLQRYASTVRVSRNRKHTEMKISQRMQSALDENLSAIDQGKSHLWGARAAQDGESLIVGSTSNRYAKRVATEVANANHNFIYSLDNSVLYSSGNRVHRNLVADSNLARGREFALWFALIESTNSLETENETLKNH